MNKGNLVAAVIGALVVAVIALSIALLSEDDGDDPEPKTASPTQTEPDPIPLESDEDETGLQECPSPAGGPPGSISDVLVTDSDCSTGVSVAAKCGDCDDKIVLDRGVEWSCSSFADPDGGGNHHECDSAGGEVSWRVREPLP